MGFKKKKKKIMQEYQHHYASKHYIAVPEFPLGSEAYVFPHHVPFQGAHGQNGRPLQSYLPSWHVFLHSLSSKKYVPCTVIHCSVGQ